MNKIIEEIKKSCSGLFPNGLYFNKFDRKFVIEGNCPASNNHNGHLKEISVYNWFDDFWIYIEINFVPQYIESKFNKNFDKKKYFEILNKKFLKIEKNYFNVKITISIFQGEYSKGNKKQLFRAEWDNYEDNKIHPQPHWHFYPEEKTSSDFVTNEDTNIFDNTIKNEIDLKQIHFAMNGQWAQRREYIHNINDGKIIVNWLVGTLKHIKEQLETSKRKYLDKIK